MREHPPASDVNGAQPRGVCRLGFGSRDARGFGHRAIMLGVKSHLVPPEWSLSDGVIALRLPSACDVTAIAQHAQAIRGLEGLWLPLETDAAIERHRWLVEDWSRAWAGLDSYDGPALLMSIPEAGGFVGRIGFARSKGAIELDYGVAPAWQGRGFRDPGDDVGDAVAIA